MSSDDRLEERNGTKYITTPSKEWETVRVQPDPPIAYLVLGRPDKNNALNTQMALELKEAIEYINYIPWESDDYRTAPRDFQEETKVIIVKGEGRDFCAGADLQKEGIGLYAEASEDIRREWLREVTYAPADALWRSRKPTVSQISGYCVGAGLSISMGCDMAVTEDQAVVGQPNARAMGFVPNHAAWPLTVGPQWTKYLLLSGNSIRGSKAEEIGMVLKSVEGEHLADEARSVADDLAENYMDMLTLAKSMINEAYRNMGWEAARESGAAFDQLGSSAGADRLQKVMEEKGSKAAWEEIHAPVLDYEDEDATARISEER